VIVFIRYVNSQGRVVSKFIGVEELQATTSDQVFEGIERVLKGFGLAYQQNMIGIATDGASVMTGVHRGVATRFKLAKPYIIATHCMAHRLQLACQKAAKKVPYLQKYISILNQFAKSLKYSPKLKRALELAKSATNEKGHKIVQIFFTRWLSFEKSVTAMAENYCSVLATLAAVGVERGTEGRALLHGLMDSMGNVRFLLMTNFLADVMAVMGRLSLSMQKHAVHYSSLHSDVEAAIESVKSIRTIPGTRLATLKEQLPEQPDNSERSDYKNTDIKDKLAKRCQFEKDAEAFIDELVTHLTSTFPDHRIMEAFHVLSPKDAQTMNAEEQNLQLEILLQHYSSLIDQKAILQEWDMFRHILCNKKYAGYDMETFMLTYVHNAAATFPQMAQLTSIGLAIPVTSVDCERGISAYNAIKDSNRCNLKVTNVDKLLHLYLQISDIEEFNFKRAFQYWMGDKERRGYMTLAMSK
jgi:hypothetical protein